jgi:hypothetical protein
MPFHDQLHGDIICFLILQHCVWNFPVTTVNILWCLTGSYIKWIELIQAYYNQYNKMSIFLLLSGGPCLPLMPQIGNYQWLHRHMAIWHKQKQYGPQAQGGMTQTQSSMAHRQGNMAHRHKATWPTDTRQYEPQTQGNMAHRHTHNKGLYDPQAQGNMTSRHTHNNVCYYSSRQVILADKSCLCFIFGEGNM